MSNKKELSELNPENIISLEVKAGTDVSAATLERAEASELASDAMIPVDPTSDAATLRTD